MILVRRSQDRGHANHGWLDTYHTFSFAEYVDPEHMGFRTLRVINEDRVAGGGGFPMHPHRDMEIITYIIEGALQHRDSMGTSSVIQPGEVQRMSAGKGVVHSEFNPSADTPVHLLQIWILTAARGIAPSYEQKAFPESERRNRLRLMASPDGAEGSVRIHQDARVYSTLLDPGATVRHELAHGRHGWVQVVKGDLAVNGQRLGAGDGAAASEEPALAIQAASPAELLVFDLG